MAQLLTFTSVLCGEDCNAGEALVVVTALICSCVFSCIGLFVFFDK